MQEESLPVERASSFVVDQERRMLKYVHKFKYLKTCKGLRVSAACSAYLLNRKAPLSVVM